MEDLARTEGRHERALARVGAMVYGKYRITRLIGVGGMGAVYAATHRNGHRVAIKFLLERYLEEPGIQQLFRREAYIANKVGHPGAVPVLDDDVHDDGCPFLVMPLLRGETLHAHWVRAGRRLALTEAGTLMSGVLDVLASAHMHGVVHRDIKPQNLFVTDAGDVRVLDFGIARRTFSDAAEGALSSPAPTVSGLLIGTPAFMPPEQALGNRAAMGPPSDCWAVGATLFTLLSGEFVHPAETLGAQLAAAATKPARSLGTIMPDLAPSIVRFVDRALAFDPRERWASATEMGTALSTAFEEALGTPLSEVTERVREQLIAQSPPPPEDARVDETHAAKRPRGLLRTLLSGRPPPFPLMPLSRPTMLTEFEGSICVVVVGEDDPSDDDFERGLEEYVVQRRADTLTGLIAWSEGGGPTLMQRNRARNSHALELYNLPRAMITRSQAARRIATAMSWFVPGIYAFAPDQLDEAFDYLKVDAKLRARILRRISNMRVKVVGKGL